MSRSFKILILSVSIFIFILVSFFLTKRNDSFLIINNQNVSFLDGDVYTYNDNVIIECNSCLFNNKKIRNEIVVKDDGEYKIVLNNKTLIIQLDKSIDFKVVDYFGNEINNYLTNKLPFKVVSENDVTVNDASYNSKSGFYSVGKYEVVTDKAKKMININDIDKNVEYDIYLTKATLPSLYAALLFSKTNNDSFIWFGNSGTFAEEYLSYLENVTLSEHCGDMESLYKELVLEVKQYISEILLNDDDAYFNLYLDDAILYLEYNIFSELGIDDNRYFVNYLTDGTLSYETEFPYMNENGYELYLEVLGKYDDVVDKIKSNKGIRNIDDSLFFIPALSRTNVAYYLQFPSYISTNDKKMTKIYNSINFISDSPAILYDNLTDKEKAKFECIIGFNKKEFDNLYFGNRDKPYLIITGTVPMDNSLGIDTFKGMIESIVNKYQDDYIILYKPHPRALPDDNFITYFEKLNIDILPGKMPMEAITFVYKDLYLGGFISSLYMSMEPENVLFFFTEDKNTVFEPIKSMLDTVYEKTEIINPSDYK